MNEPEATKLCKSHKWEPIEGLKGRYRCARCGTYGHGAGFGITAYAAGKSWWERQQKQQQSGRRA